MLVTYTNTKNHIIYINLCYPPKIPRHDSNPGLCDTLSLTAIIKSYTNSSAYPTITNCFSLTFEQPLNCSFSILFKEYSSHINNPSSVFVIPSVPSFLLNPIPQYWHRWCQYPFLYYHLIWLLNVDTKSRI